MDTNGPRSRCAGTWRDEGGFTLPELVATIAILGILIVIAVIVLLGILEQRRVDAAARQLVADMRLVHTSAANQLTDWRIVLVPERGGEDEGPDYYLVRLAQTYEPSVSGSTPVADPNTPPKPRFFPANVEVRDHNSALNDAPANPAGLILPAPARTRTAEFNSDGTMGFRLGPSGSVCVTSDGDPQRRVIAISATSRVQVKAAYNETPCS